MSPSMHSRRSPSIAAALFPAAILAAQPLLALAARRGGGGGGGGEEGDEDTGTRIGIIVGVIVALIAIYCIYRCCKNKKQEEAQDPEKLQGVQPTTVAAPHPAVAHQQQQFVPQPVVQNPPQQPGYPMLNMQSPAVAPASPYPAMHQQQPYYPPASPYQPASTCQPASTYQPAPPATYPSMPTPGFTPAQPA
ncbi:hypothetical protein BGZ94_003535, partial [Podila epigama]